MAQCVLERPGNMLKVSTLRALGIASVLALTPFAVGCGGDAGQSSDDITDVNHTDVERQSIGNCWLYAHATWIESMNLTATGTAFDVHYRLRPSLRSIASPTATAPSSSNAI